MSTRLQSVRGTQSLYGSDADRLHRVISAFNKVRRRHRFRRVEVPVFEATEVFARSIGETTDIVSKEMYTFEDQGGDSITLRPEFTAGICRAYVSEGWQQHAPMKLATYGPVFRYERPQKGRFRQFHQLDAEIIGTDSSWADVELLTFADELLRELRISDDVTLELNTLGDSATREAWRAALVAHFESHKSHLSDESRNRLARNPLRILDSKEQQDRPIAESAPSIDHFLTSDAAAFFAEVTARLDAAGVSWTRNPRLVRGLDYYRHTAFEFVTNRLGSQGAVIAGGRYDGLIESLGGPPTPAVGWAAGIERLGMLIEAPQARFSTIAVVPDKPDLEDEAFRLASHLRQNLRKDIAIDIAFRGNAKSRIENARRKNVSAILILRDSSQPTRLHLTHYEGDEAQRRDLAADILSAVEGLYSGGISGGGPR